MLTRGTSVDCFRKSRGKNHPDETGGNVDLSREGEGRYEGVSLEARSCEFGTLPGVNMYLGDIVHRVGCLIFCFQF